MNATEQRDAIIDRFYLEEAIFIQELEEHCGLWWRGWLHALSVPIYSYIYICVCVCVWFSCLRGAESFLTC